MKLKVRLNARGYLILEERVKENHQEHNVAKPKEIMSEVIIELKKVIKA
tara:strand:- start:57 stop:203 length:147 start_codon:yes stop_codon:yes gene_type:complete